MADFLTDKRTEIDNRLKELRPLHEEYLKLERAKAALEGVDGPRRAPARRGGGGRRRRGRRGGTSDRVLEVIRQNPGITVREIADRVGMKQPNYLYRVLPRLEGEGAVKRQGRGWSAG